MVIAALHSAPQAPSLLSGLIKLFALCYQFVREHANIGLFVLPPVVPPTAN